MRAFVALLLIGAAPARAETFPWVGLVIEDNVEARCGPSTQHYPTGLLARGTRVEVHRAENGWLAIRPPEGSFSWIAVRHLRDPNVAVAEVATRHAVAWIGSTLAAPTELRWQVRLDRGEAVEVLGQQRMTPHADAAEEPHAMIAPPSGEFRWVHRRAVRPEDSARADDVALDRFRVGSAEPASLGRPAAPSRRASEERPVPELARPELVRLDDVEFRLSQIASDDVTTWDIAPLQRATEELVRRAASLADRRRGMELLGRLDRFADLQRRQTGSPETPRPVQPATALEPVAEPSGPANGVPATPRLALPPDPSLYDGEGWLMPVVTRDRQVPRFALLDREGTVKCYVSPAPGLNLHRYLKQEVGVIGRRETVTHLDAPHITAQRVVSLNRHRLATGPTSNGLFP